MTSEQIPGSDPDWATSIDGGPASIPGDTRVDDKMDGVDAQVRNNIATSQKTVDQVNREASDRSPRSELPRIGEGPPLLMALSPTYWAVGDQVLLTDTQEIASSDPKLQYVRRDKCTPIGVDAGKPTHVESLKSQIAMLETLRQDDRERIADMRQLFVRHMSPEQHARMEREARLMCELLGIDLAEDLDL